MQRKAQIIVKSCNRRDLELSHVRNFLLGNNYAIEETEARQFVSLDPAKISKEADLILLSTCGFSSVSEQYSLEAIEMVKKHMKPSAELIICGCLPSINPDGLKMYFKGQSFNPRSYEKLNEIINPSKSYQEFKHNNITNFYGKDVFTIQIHEGCPRNCSYCAIKLSIGQLKSTPLDEIMTQFKIGLAQGYKNFMFLGDCSGGYGLDIGSSFGELLGRVLDLEGDFSLSLTDIAPFYFPQCFSEIKELCSRNILPSLYIATQSANPRILTLMRRTFDMREAKSMLLTLKNINPHLELI